MDQPLDRAQHYIECSICTNYSALYCNTCHKQICEQCREAHQEEKADTNHEIVSYQERIKELTVDKCRIHPKKDVDLHCSDCQVPVCSKCFALNHNTHSVLDLEIVYEESQKECRELLSKMKKIILPQTEEKLLSHTRRTEDMKRDIASLRTSMKNRADQLKAAVVHILCCKNAKLDEIENDLINETKDNENKLSCFISYLRSKIEDFEARITLSDPINLIALHTEMSSSLLKIPDIAGALLPQFTPVDIKIEVISQLFGTIKMMTKETRLKIEGSGKAETEKHLKLSPSVKVVKELNMPGLYEFCHLSALPTSNKFWANTENGKLMKCDIKGNLLQEISTSTNNGRFHAVTVDEKLLYIKEGREIIFKNGNDTNLKPIFTIQQGRASSIYSSHINGDILVGIEGGNRGKVSRYNNKGMKLSDILRDDKGWPLYQSICCITENINGDICISDSKAGRVVVVNKSGKYRFSYYGQSHSSKTELSSNDFQPTGICSDVVGHILVCIRGTNEPYILISCDTSCEETGIHLLDKDGQFLSLIGNGESFKFSKFSGALCAAYNHNLVVGCLGRSSVKVLEYLQDEDT